MTYDPNYNTNYECVYIYIYDVPMVTIMIKD